MSQSEFKVKTSFRIVISSETNTPEISRLILERARVMHDLLLSSPLVSSYADGGVHIASAREQIPELFAGTWKEGVHTRFIGRLFFLSMSMREEAEYLQRVFAHSVRVIILGGSTRPHDSYRVLYRDEYDLAQDLPRLIGI